MRIARNSNTTYDNTREKRNDKSNDEEKEEKSSGRSVVQNLVGTMRRRMSFCKTWMYTCANLCTGEKTVRPGKDDKMMT